MADIPTVQFVDPSTQKDNIPKVEMFAPGEYVKQEVSNLKEVPIKMRFLVAGAPNQESKIATLKKFYDTVEPIEGGKNFIVKDSQGRKFVFNDTEKTTMGDVADFAKMGTEAVFGGLGAIGGTILNPGAGTVLGAGAGQAYGAELYEKVAQAFGAESLRTSGEHLKDRATDFVFGSVGQAAAPFIGNAVKRGVVGGAEKVAEASKRLNSFINAGATPSLSQVTQNKGIQTVEMLVNNLPGGGGIAKFAQNAQDDLGKGATKIAGEIIGSTVPADEQMAGRVVKLGLKNEGDIHAADTFVGRFKAKAGELFDRVDDFMPKNTGINLDNTTTALNKLIAPIQGAENTQKVFKNAFLNELFEGMEKDLVKNNGTLPYEAVKAIKQKIGNKLSDLSLISDVSKGELKQIYGALSQDILSSAAKQGGEPAVNALLRANKFYEAGTKRIDDFLKPIYNKADPDQLVKYLLSSSTEGASKFNALKKSLTPDQYKVLVSSIIDRLGRSNAGQAVSSAAEDVLGQTGRFSSETFLTNWNKLNPRVKDIMFTGKGLGKDLAKHMDDLADAASIIRESGKTFKNPSGSADRLVGQGAIGGIIGASFFNPKAILTLPLLYGTSSVTAKMLTNPNLVKWMADGTKIATNSIPEHIGRLGVVAATTDPEVRQHLYEFLNVVKDTSGVKASKEPQPVTTPTPKKSMGTIIPSTPVAQPRTETPVLNRNAFTAATTPTAGGQITNIPKEELDKYSSLFGKVV